MLSPLLFGVLFAAAIPAVLVRFSEDQYILRDLVHLEEDLGEDEVQVDPLAYVRRAVRGMIYADDAGFVPKSAEGLANMMTYIVAYFEAAGPTVSEQETETMLLRIPNQALRTSAFVIEAAGLRHRQTMQALGLCQRSNDESVSQGHMLQSAQAGAVRCRGCRVYSKAVHAQGPGW